MTALLKLLFNLPNNLGWQWANRSGAVSISPAGRVSLDRKVRPLS